MKRKAVAKVRPFFLTTKFFKNFLQTFFKFLFRSSFESFDSQLFASLCKNLFPDCGCKGRHYFHTCKLFRVFFSSFLQFSSFWPFIPIFIIYRGCKKGYFCASKPYFCKYRAQIDFENCPTNSIFTFRQPY